MVEVHVDVSVIVPIHNGGWWIDRCFESIRNQQNLDEMKIEICVTNDASSDNSLQLLNKCIDVFKNINIEVKIFSNDSRSPRGVGYAKNKAVGVSTGTYLCFQDVDDVMLPERIFCQLSEAKKLPANTILGSQFRRAPENSTPRFTKWANTISHDQLQEQIYTSHGPTVIMPTWFCHRSVFDEVGGFSENGRGTPEDLIFFYKHLDSGGRIHRVDRCLLIYFYHPDATTFFVKEATIWELRLNRLERLVLPKWKNFTIWNAGKQGRKFYNLLSPGNQTKVLALCDVDENKIGKKYIPYDPSNKPKSERPIDIIHFKTATPPFILCMKMDLTNGEFENNLQSLQLTESIDYVWFS